MQVITASLHKHVLLAVPARALRSTLIAERLIMVGCEVWSGVALLKPNHERRWCLSSSCGRLRVVLVMSSSLSIASIGGEQATKPIARTIAGTSDA